MNRRAGVVRNNEVTPNNMVAKPDRGESTAHHAVMALRAEIHADAMTGELLGSEREGLAIRIRADGLALTVGYLCLEAERLWLTNAAGNTSPAQVIAQDTESGLALVRPDMPLGEAFLQTGSLDGVGPNHPLRVINDATDFAMPCQVVAVSEFVGRWEYVIDQALYTVPACDNWGGAALLDGDGALVGIGSLFLELPAADGESVYGNLFVPVELVAPYIDDLCLHGARRTPAPPWMGWMIQEHEGKLMVVGIYPGGPAQRAGIHVEDTVAAINGEPVKQLSELFRGVRRLGSAGVEVPVTLDTERSPREVVVASIERNGFFQRRPNGQVN